MDFFPKSDKYKHTKSKPTIKQGLAIVGILCSVMIGGIFFVIYGLVTIIDIPEEGSSEYSIFLIIFVGGFIALFYGLSKFISDRWNVEIK